MFLIPDPFERRTARRRKVGRRDRLGRQVDLADAAHHRSDTANRISGRTTLLMRPRLAITWSGTWQPVPPESNLATPVAKLLRYVMAQANGGRHEGLGSGLRESFRFFNLNRSAVLDPAGWGRSVVARYVPSAHCLMRWAAGSPPEESSHDHSGLVRPKGRRSAIIGFRGHQ